MHDRTAFFTLDVRVAILLAFASVLHPLAVVSLAAPGRRRRAPLLDNTTSYHRPDPSSGTMLPEVTARSLLPESTVLEKTEQVTVSDTRRLVSKNNNTTSYHRPDPSSGTMLPEVIARLYDGARPWSSIAEDQGRGGNTGAVNVR